MHSISRSAAILLAVFSVSACSGRVPTQGFKDLHYGMSLDELRARGFDCQADEFYCSSERPQESGYTLFGKEASVHVQTSEGRLSSVSVSIDVTSDELIALYTREFGEPQTFTYRSLGGQSERHFWHAGDRAAISVTRSTRGDRSVLGMTFSSADYLGPEATQALLEEASSNTVQGGDY